MAKKLWFVDWQWQAGNACRWDFCPLSIQNEQQNQLKLLQDCSCLRNLFQRMPKWVWLGQKDRKWRHQARKQPGVEVGHC